jgi:hypothetical protein
MSQPAERINPEDIKSKLGELQGGALEQVDSAKNQLLAVGVGVGLVLLVLAFLLGRRGGKRASAVIEVRRG